MGRIAGASGATGLRASKVSWGLWDCTVCWVRHPPKRLILEDLDDLTYFGNYDMIAYGGHARF